MLIGLGVVVCFLATITVYKFNITHQNNLLVGDADQIRRAMKGGVTEEQVNMGWKYEGW